MGFGLLESVIKRGPIYRPTPKGLSGEQSLAQTSYLTAKRLLNKGNRFDAGGLRAYPQTGGVCHAGYHIRQRTFG
jgi:hypothetical protein